MQRKYSEPHSFEDRLAAEKKRLEEQAALLPHGAVKDALERKIGQLEIARRLHEDLRSSDLPRSK
jgi:hypothetical protein